MDDLAVICTSSGRQSWKDMSALDVRVTSSFRPEFTFISHWDIGVVFLTWRESTPSLPTSTLQDTRRKVKHHVLPHCPSHQHSMPEKCTPVLTCDFCKFTEESIPSKRARLSPVTQWQDNVWAPLPLSLLIPLNFPPSHPDCSMQNLVITWRDNFKSPCIFSNATPALACTSDH